jgi:hypothetical protein
LVPVTVTVYVPEGVLAVELTLNIDVFDEPEETARLVGFREKVGPMEETVADRLIVPLKPFWLVTVIVEVLDEPCRNVIEVGFDATEKFGVGGAWTMKLPIIDG